MRLPETSRVLGLLAMLIIAALVNGCSRNNMEDLREFVAQEKAKPRGAIDPLPEIKPYETFAYDASGLRDPFEPMDFGQSNLAGAGGGGTGDMQR